MKYKDGLNEKKLLYYRILIYFCISTFFTPIAIPIVLASDVPQPGSGWTPMQGPNDSFYKSVTFSVSTSFEGFIRKRTYKMEVWFWQYIAEDYAPFYDYYICTISLYEVSTSGWPSFEETKAEIFLDIYEADISQYAQRAVWIDASPEPGEYGSEGTITVSVSMPIDGVTFGIRYTIELHEVKVTHESRPSSDPYILYKFIHKSLSIPYQSAFGDVIDDKWMILFVAPDGKNDGNILNPPIDGDMSTAIKIYMPYGSRYFLDFYSYRGGRYIYWDLYDLG